MYILPANPQSTTPPSSFKHGNNNESNKLSMAAPPVRSKQKKEFKFDGFLSAQG